MANVVQYTNYHDTGIYEISHSWWSGYSWNKIEISKYVPPADPVAVIGIVAGSARLLVVAHDSSGVKATMTQTTFDTTTRADSARILLTDSTGGTVFIRGAGIAANPIVRLSGSEGFIHDRYVDYESIAKDGERRFELGNDFVVSAAQVTMLADYYWKNSKTKRHIYDLTILGFCSYFEPGEWYTLAIGGAGEQEYVSSVVECYAVRCSQQAGNIGQTQVAFREMYQNWVFDSNEVARSIASGRHKGTPNSNIVYVAPDGYIGKADYYCDGTADNQEIDAAASYIHGSYGSGIIHLLPGTYDISSSIVATAGITYRGEGYGTYLQANNVQCFLSSSGVEISSLTIRNLAIGAATGFTAINIAGGDITVDFVTIENTTNYGILLQPFSAEPTRRVLNCNIAGGATSSQEVIGIYTIGSDITIMNNVVRNLKGSGVPGKKTRGILSGGGQIIANTISTITATSTSMTAYGISIADSDAVVNSNRIDTITNSATPTVGAYGIFITTALTHVSVVQNIVHNCANDTLYANTGNWLFNDNGTSTLTSVNSWQ